MATHTCDHALLACVHIDGDDTIIGTITAVTFRSGLTLYEVSWMHNGGQHQHWIEEGRLDPAEDDMPATRRRRR